MPTFHFPMHQTRPAQFIVGVLALLLVCGAALLGGETSDRNQITKGQSRWSEEAGLPLLNTTAYPKDFNRNADPRWRQLLAGDDLYDLDPPDAHPHHAACLQFASAVISTSYPDSGFSVFPHTHRPQAARAPPLV